MNTGSEALVTFSPAKRTPTDRSLMEEVQAGSTKALGRLFERHHEKLYTYFVRLTRDRSLAEDLVQEVFVRILKYSRTFRMDLEFEPWMYRLARNAATDLYHARPKELPEAEDAPEAPATGPHPLEALERAQTVKSLNRAMGSLHADAREALLLARFSGLKYQDIGGILGISEGAVKGRVHRAVLDLKKAYRAEAAKPGKSGRQ